MVDEEAVSEIKAFLARSGEGEELMELLAPLQPYDLSEIALELESDEGLLFFARLPTNLAAETLEYLDPEDQYRILHHLEDEVAIPLLKAMSSDIIVDLLLAIHPFQAEQLLNWLPEEYRKQIDTLMTFPENTAGSLATVDYIAAREAWTVERTLAHVRKVGRGVEVASYIYVVNNRRQLVDVISLRQIILADPKARLADITNNYVISVRADTDQEEAARILSEYDFVALPVVDADDRFVGIVTVDDLFDVITEEATEDVHKMGGSEPLTESYFKTSVTLLYRKRVVWLLLLFLAEAYTSNVLRHFEETLSQAVALAFFIPLLIGTGGNTGSQTVAILVRALAIGEVEFKDVLRVVGRELATGIMLGSTLGVATYLRAYVMGVGVRLGPVVALSGMFIVVWASTVAAILPIVLHRLKVDPAVVSGPLISTLVDGTGLFLYFSLARVMLGLG